MDLSAEYVSGLTFYGSLAAAVATGSQYANLKLLADGVHAKQPDALVYVNAGDGAANSKAFDEAYLDEVQPDVMSFGALPINCP